MRVDKQRLARHVVARLMTGVPRIMDWDCPNGDEEALLVAIEAEAEREVECAARYPLVRGVKRKGGAGGS